MSWFPTNQGFLKDILKFWGSLKIEVWKSMLKPSKGDLVFGLFLLLYLGLFSSALVKCHSAKIFCLVTVDLQGIVYKGRHNSWHFSPFAWPMQNVWKDSHSQQLSIPHYIFKVLLFHENDCLNIELISGRRVDEIAVLFSPSLLFFGEGKEGGKWSQMQRKWGLGF